MSRSPQLDFDDRQLVIQLVEERRGIAREILELQLKKSELEIDIKRRQLLRDDLSNRKIGQKFGVNAETVSHISRKDNCINA